MAEKKKFSFGRAFFTFIITLVTIFCLVAAGFGVCIIPKTTDLVSHAFTGNAASPFTKDQLIEAAIAGRDYTVDTNDKQAMVDVIAKINDAAKTPYANASEQRLLAAPDTYTLTPDAFSHLDDCFRIFSVAKIVCLVALGIMVLGLIVVRVRSGRKTFGRALFYSGLIVLVAFLALAAWVIIDFYGFFTVFHSFFFADGTWTFSANSLLISMYPTQFWVAMAIIWVATSCLASAIFMIVGRALIRRAKKKEQAAREAAAREAAAQASLYATEEPAAEDTIPGSPVR